VNVTGCEGADTVGGWRRGGWREGNRSLQFLCKRRWRFCNSPACSPSV